ncbi:RNA polymerase factor sigma-54 [Vulcaniibacterium gelatinicum]|uniref:RNA polymerase factor sigma-54 n=1 Tax=Vulcaniibacterium gelatinicum TaxID=2598725 RepID=UPI0011C7F82C|nr:RNA polymerase factor sigma-54 [Vulcaniibacterium gelatinicum]
MKPRLQASLGQHLVMTPQLRQAIRLLQLSQPELEQEIRQAVESNPLLDWAEPEPRGAEEAEPAPAAAESEPGQAPPEEDTPAWEPEEPWPATAGGGHAPDEDAPPADQAAEPETLQDHLLWQLHLSALSPRDRLIGAALIEAIDADGYLRAPLADIAAALPAELGVTEDEIVTVLHRVQHFDPVGVGARCLAECLRLQLELLPEATPGRALALSLAEHWLERLPRAGVPGLAQELGLPLAEVEGAVQLLRSLDPRPGAQHGGLGADTYIVPDCVVWREHGQWRVALAAGALPPVSIHRGYERLIRSADEADAAYLRGRLQEARWLLKSLKARGETLLKVMRCLVREQAAFLEFGEQALRPLTLREVAAEVGLHESTISRAIARKYARTPRGTIPLRAFFASGIETGAGGETSSTAIQAMIRRLIEAENPRKPLSDARLAETLKATGVPVARRTVAKYREAMNIPASHERVRMD